MCEDYPCCGHEDGGCPTTLKNGELRYPCATCGKRLPKNSPSSICNACERRHRYDEDDLGQADY